MGFLLFSSQIKKPKRKPFAEMIFPQKNRTVPKKPEGTFCLDAFPYPKILKNHRETLFEKFFNEESYRSENSTQVPFQSQYVLKISKNPCCLKNSQIFEKKVNTAKNPENIEEPKRATLFGGMKKNEKKLQKDEKKCQKTQRDFLS